jgi:hypothetical protein
MTGIRRSLILIGLTGAVMIGASIPASATFADSAAVPHTVSTLTVAAPASVTVDDYCITTTTRTSTTTRRDPTTGVVTTTAYSSYVTSSDRSGSNVQGSTTTSTAGPGAYETTTTTDTTNTDLVVNMSWSASGSRGVSGYLVSAHLGDGSSIPMGQTDSVTTGGGARVDADYLGYQPSLSVTTLTSYGWTATSARTAVLAC